MTDGDHAEPFELALRTRGYEADFTGTIPMPAFFRYFEYTRWELMREPRLGLLDAVHAGHFFVVRQQNVELLRHLGQGVPLIVRTWFDEVGRISATVHHEALRADDGALVAQARVTGVWIGPNRKMTKLPAKMRALAKAQIAALADGPTRRGVAADVATSAAVGGQRTSFFEPLEVVHPELGLDVTPPPPTTPTEASFHLDLIVPHRDLDIFSHVNAATWLSYCDEARHAAARAGVLPAAAAAGGFNVRATVKYFREAVAGDPLRVHLWPVADTPRALGFAIARGPEGEISCTARVDTAAGGGAISAPRPGM